MSFIFRNSAVCLIALSALLGVAQPQSKPGTPRPNIVFILADDMGYGDVSAYGQKKVATPNIDRLASQGMRFTNFYSGATICSPSRSVLMTGLHTGHTRIRGNAALAGGIVGRKGATEMRRMHLLETDTTIGNTLGAAGYRTAVIGKWHLDGFNPHASPMDRGFDEFYGWMVSEPSTYASTYFPPKRFANRELKTIAANQNGAEGYYHPDMCFDEAKAFINAHKDGPFYLHVGLNLPHSPYQTNNFGPYADRDWPEPYKHYAGMLHWTDAFVGKLMAFLAAAGLDSNTIVFFSSDNGPRSEPTPLQTQTIDFFDSNGPLRGYKRDLSEGGIRIPMIVRWPGKIAAGSVSDVPGYFADLRATFADLTHASKPQDTDGLSIAPVLLGQSDTLGERFLYWEDFEGSFEQAVRWGPWKAIVPIHGTLELYNLDQDIHEDRNLAGEHPEIVDKIKTYLKTARSDSENWPVIP